jgi:hypothetical protein
MSPPPASLLGQDQSYANVALEYGGTKPAYL